MFFWLSPTSLPRLDMSILPPSGAGFGVADVRFGVADVRLGMADVGLEWLMSGWEWLMLAWEWLMSHRVEKAPEPSPSAHSVPGASLSASLSVSTP